MSRTKGLMARLRGILGRSAAEARMDEEFQFHLEMEAKKNMSRGVAPEVARRQAAVVFGGVERYREEMRDGRGARALEELWIDVRYATRALRLNPTFSLVVLLTLALGIGANTAVFTLVDALLLRPLPVPHPEQLVAVGDPTRVNSASIGSMETNLFSYPLYQDIRSQKHGLADMFASGRTGRLQVRIDDGGGTGATSSGIEHPIGRFVSGNFFTVLQVRPALGRAFGPDDDRTAGAGGNPVVVISHEYWVQRFGSDPGVLRRTINVNRVPMTVTGVAARGFSGEVVGQRTDLWLPITMQPALAPHRPWLENREVNWLLAMGRLRPGGTAEQAQAAITAIVNRVLDEQEGAPDADSRNPVPVSSGERGLSRLRSIYGESLTTLMIAVTLVLLIVCANVASLMLARASVRAREMSVRVALGARRLRLIRQLLTESLLLASLGSALGLLIAWWGSRGLLRIASGGPDPIPLDVRLDLRVLAFSAALAVIAAVLFGLLPALRATRTEVALTLRSQSRGIASGPLGTSGRRWGIGKVLVAGQVALSIVLLVGTGMLLRSMAQLDAMDPGVARDRMMIVTIDAAATGASGEQLNALMRSLLERVRAVPGVAAATFSENGLFSGTESSTTMSIDGFVAKTRQDTSVNYDRVGPNYVRAIGAQLIAGRDIEERDQMSSAPVTLINATMADYYFGNRSPLGQYVRVDSTRFEIVGVVRDVIGRDLRAAPQRRLYVPMSQAREDPPQQVTFEVRASGDPTRLAAPLRDALLAANPNVTVLTPAPLTDLMRRSVSADRLLARITALFGTVALILSALGLYGLMSYMTLRRINEFGLRQALGAPSNELARMVLGEAFVMIGAGALAGLPLAIGAMHLIRSRLFGVSVLDPASLLAAFAILAGAVLVAAYLPAARAARVSPLVALRSD